MFRLMYFVGIFFVTAILGWWVFFPLAIAYIYLVRMPYELIIMGAILDQVYYLGNSFIYDYMFTIFSFVSVVATVFLEKKLQWENSM